MVVTEVVRSEEQLVVATRREPLGTVGIGKRIVSEERVVTVTVRREELVVDERPSEPGATLMSDQASVGPSADDGSAAPVLELILYEEVVEVVTRVVPVERVRVFRDTATHLATVEETVGREVVDVSD